MSVRVIGCGNPLVSDDGVGVRVIEELKQTVLPSDVELITAGNDPFRVLDMLRGVDKVIIVDAAAGATPGEIMRLTPKDIELSKKTGFSLHHVSIAQVLELGKQLYPKEMPEEVQLYAIGVSDRQPFSVGLSPTAENAALEAARLILKEVSTGN